MAQEGDQQQPQEVTNRKVRPVITPDAFAGEPVESWDDWLGHFESFVDFVLYDFICFLSWLYMILLLGIGFYKQHFIVYRNSFVFCHVVIAMIF